jgi:hypothetical protein
LPLEFSALLVAGAVALSVLLSFFHAQSPSVFDHELSAGAEVTISSFLVCSCVEALPTGAAGGGVAVLVEAAAAASSLV